MARRICWSISAEFGAGVAAQDLVGIAGLHRHHALFGLGENRGHVGEIELAVMIVGAQFVDSAEQGPGVERVKTGIDLMYFLLRRRQIFLLDDGLHIIAAGFLANDSSVSAGVFEAGRENSHCGLFCKMEIAQSLDRRCR